MKRKTKLFLMLLLSLCLCGCSSEKRQNKSDVFIYYLNTDGTAIEQQEYELQATTFEEKIKELLSALKTTPKSPNMKATIPNDINIEKFSVVDRQLEIYYNQTYLKMTSSAEVLLRAAVVQTMMQVDGIEYISFYVGEEALKDSAGNPIGLMSTETFVQNTGSALYAYQTTPLKLYFGTADGTKLLEEQKNQVRYPISTSIEKLVVEQLMKGPGGANATPTIPDTVTLLGVSVKEGICYVNFSASFLTDSYNQKPEVTIYSVVNSIIENGSALKVQILVEGASDAVFMNSIDLSKPLEWNADIIKES